MGNSDSTISGRCSAVIPLDNENGIECGATATVRCEEGFRCESCFQAFGGVIAEGPDAEMPAPVNPFYRTSQARRKALINAQRNAAVAAPRIADLGTLMTGVIGAMEKGGIL